MRVRRGTRFFHGAVVAVAGLICAGPTCAEDVYLHDVDGPGRPPEHYVDSPPLPGAVVLDGFARDGDSERAGVQVPSPLPSDYDWWNGCVPTAAGMLFGYWEEHGHDAFPGNHRNLPATYPNTSTNPAHYQDARGVIAGWAHKQAGMTRGYQYGSSTDHLPDSLADFMLTSDGSTERKYGIMAHGMETFAAWDDLRTPAIESQKFDVRTVFTPIEHGEWTYAEYCAEIDAGRPVHLGLDSDDSGHGVLGVGYYNQNGAEDVVLLTTWHSGVQQWEWSNETHSGHQYSVYGARLATPDPTPTPRLSAYSYVHTLSQYGDRLLLTDVEIGIGSPDAPLWSTHAGTPELAPGEIHVGYAVTDIDCTGATEFFEAGPQQWFVKIHVDRPYDEDEEFGTIQDFQIRYEFDEKVFHYDGSPVVIDENGTACAYLNTVPYPYLPGDANHDTKVDELDAQTLAAHWGDDGATWETGDFDGDGAVNAADAAILAANWQTAPAGSTSVPEPSAAPAILLAVGLLSATSRRLVGGRI